jgi:serine/threonine protein kinase
MLNNVLKKVQNTLNEGIKNMKMIVNTLNENRPILTIQEKKYYQDELIAEGGYALIYKIQSVSDEKMYALKKITIQSPNHKKQIKREIKIWKELSKFSNIVELVDFIFTERHAYIVMEYCEEGTLLDFVNNHEGNISEVEALLIFNQVLLGVNAMHSQKPPIAHRDLKIENILKKKRNYKLCDFGSATTETFDPTTSDEFVKEQNFSNFEKHSTLYYRAPEMCDRYGEHVVSEKVDIWALGCVLYTMVFKEQPFMNAQKLEIINGNYNFPQEEQKLYSEKFLDLIRVMLTPNPDNRPDVLKIMEWTNYWNDIDKIPLSPEVEEIKKKQISSGGLKNKSHKKKLLSAEEIEKIQSKLKKKEKKAKNYDEINEIFGFAKSKNDEEDQKEDNNNTNNNNNNQINDMLFDVFGGQPQNEKKKEEKKGQDDLLEFYEVDESKQGNNTTNKNTNLNNDLDSIFGAASNTNNSAPKNNDNKNNNSNGNNNFDLLFSNQNENVKQTNNENKQKTDLGELLNNLNNKENNGIKYEMNGNDFFSSFPSSQPAKKEEAKPKEDDLFAAFNQPKENKKEESNKAKVEDDLFSAFSQPQTKQKESKKEEPKKQNLEDDLFSAFSQPQSKPKEEKKEADNKPKVEDDLFAAFSQPQSQPKPKEENKKEENKPKMEDDLFAAFSQPQSKPKEEPKKADNNSNNMFDDLFSGSNQTKQEKPAEGKKEIKNDLQFDLFNFGDSSNKNTESAPANQSSGNKDNLDLLFSLNNNNGNVQNGGEANKENGQTQKAPEVNNANSNAGNKNQDIFAFFQ